MNADGFAPDATSRDPFPPPTDAAAPANPRTWRRDVVDGVTRRFAIAIVPALVVALIVRLLRSDWALQPSVEAPSPRRRRSRSLDPVAPAPAWH